MAARNIEDRTLSEDCPELIPYLSSGLTVLDVGCGPGTITSDIANSVSPGAVVGIDIKEDRITNAIDLAKEKELANLSFKVMNVHELDFPDDYFDLVLSYTVAHFWVDPVKAMRELRRVCRKGACIITAGLRDLCAAPRYPKCPNWESAWSAMTRFYEAKRDSYLENGKEPEGFWDLLAGRKCVEWYSEAGIENIELKLKVEDWLYPGSIDMDSSAADFLNLDEKSDWKAVCEAVDQGFMDKEVLKKARAETIAWKANPHAFHYHPVVMAVGRA
jgi:SAM-dependent methyltransferase